MHLKRYRSDTVRDALARARAELGPTALVLSTRLVAASGWRGWMGHREVEVTAALNRDMSDYRPIPPLGGHPAPDAARAMAAPPPDTSGEARGAAVDAVVARLCAAGIDRELATEIADSVPRAQRRQASVELLRRAVADHLGPLTAGDDALTGAEVFVGPPGVGKTTTIAKIASQERARRGLRLRLVSADGFRVGAVEQLRLYANILGAPFEVARTSAELETVLAGVKGPALVDTAGRSACESQAHGLLELLGRATGVRTHLVLSAASRPRDVARLLDAYAPARPSRVALTRLDETDTLGPIVALLRERGLPVSFLGTGQRVPEDLVRATAPALAGYLVGEGLTHAGGRP